MGGSYAEVNRVVRGGNREVEVTVDLVCLYPDGQFKYEIQAVGHVTIPHGDPVPEFVVRGLPQSFLAGEQPTLTEEKSHSVNPDLPMPCPSPFEGLEPGNYQVVAHTVCRDPDGNVKWEADTEPVPFVVEARPQLTPED